MNQSEFTGLPEDNSITRPPLFSSAKYTFWKNRMKNFIQAQSYQAWLVVENDPYEPTVVVDGQTVPKPPDTYTPEDFRRLRENANAINMLHCAVTDSEYNRISGCETAKEIWDKLEVTYEGTSKVKEAKIDLLQQKMEMFRMEPKEAISDMNTRFVSLANELKRLGKEMTEPEMVKKFLRSLTKDWEAKKTAIEEAHNLNSYSYDELIGNLLTQEMSLARYKEQESKAEEKKKTIALRAEKSRRDSVESERGTSSRIKELEEERDQLALVVKRFNKLFEREEKRRFRKYRPRDPPERERVLLRTRKVQTP